MRFSLFSCVYPFLFFYIFLFIPVSLSFSLRASLFFFTGFVFFLCVRIFVSSCVRFFFIFSRLFWVSSSFFHSSFPFFAFSSSIFSLFSASLPGCCCFCCRLLLVFPLIFTCFVAAAYFHLFNLKVSPFIFVYI